MKHTTYEQEVADLQQENNSLLLEKISAKKNAIDAANKIAELERENAEIYALREQLERAKKDRDAAWDAFTRLRKAYAMIRYPTLNEEIKLLYDTADAIANGKKAKELAIRPEWIDKLAKQYGARQHAALLGDRKTYEAADNWMRLTADAHWHEIIVALQRPPLSEEQPHGAKVKP